MLPTCLISELKIFRADDNTRRLASELSCPELAAEVLKTLRDDSEDINLLRERVRPDFMKQLASLDLGSGSSAAKELWESKSSFGNVLVYGDYDTDGISSTVLAMEIFRNKAAQVRYFIPRRDIHGYGLNYEILDKVVSWGCNTLVVVDCGTNDSEMLEKLKNAGVNIFVFDHHSVSTSITIPTIVNPSINMDKGEQQKICATAVLWCWACKENIISRNFLKYSIDLVALATIADCMPLHNLNRLLVRYGINLMRSNPRRGLGALFDCLSINKTQLSEEHLSMKVIPCLNAPGRIATADVGVRALLGTGSNDSVYSCVNELTRINRKRQTLTEEIARKIDTGITNGTINQKVLFNSEWPIGVLSGVASRVCAEYNRPIALAAPANAGKIIRGTLRVPEGGDAVGVLKEISGKLDAWGGHKYAAGFSVLPQNWQEVNAELERVLANITITKEKLTPVIDISPSDIKISDWLAVCELGPFGNNNLAPRLFAENNPNLIEISPLGKDNKHSYLKIGSEKILAFGVSPKDILTMNNDIKGFIYHPRLDYWRNEQQLQFILECAVIEDRKE
ncbi:MAG: DHH family phosphoesterase [Synergistaceae bacterium]|nr:DHH family phosphoesterase [Synergistaceae bacterium]